MEASLPVEGRGEEEEDSGDLAEVAMDAEGGLAAVAVKGGMVAAAVW